MFVNCLSFHHKNRAMLKKVLIGIGGLFVLVIIAAIVIPIIFKDDIKAAIEDEIEKNVNADVFFNADLFDVTLFSNFPNLTVSLGEFGVINRAPFEGQVLLAVEKFEVEVNLKNILFDDEMRIKGILLDKPQIYVRVLEDGSANYDIAIASEDSLAVEEVEEATEAGETENMSFGIDRWEIRNAYLEYIDETMSLEAKLSGLTHSGSGDFTLSVFDLATLTHIDTVAITFDEVTYIDNRSFDADLTLNINLDESRYSFKENEIKLNDFALAFDGWVSMPEEDIDMDITYSSTDNSFKSLLSLIPAIYTSDFDDIQTSGNLSFDGMVKGKLTENSMPAFNLGLVVGDAMFQYPDLPSAVQNINIDLKVDNQDGVIDNTVVDLRKLHLEFGSNPIDARVLVKNLVNYPVEANASAQLDLAELSTMFPMEGIELKGNFGLNLVANGVYDSINSIIPAIDLNMSLKDGYVKSSDFPIPLENMRLQSSVLNTSGKMAETLIKVEDFGMKLGEDEINAQMTVQNLDDYNWDVKIQGGLDIGEMMKIFPQEGMTVTGKIAADITTSGKMSDLDAEQYDKLPTSGSLTLSDFSYSDAEVLPSGMNIKKADLEFDPRAIQLQSLYGNVGNTDLDLSGNISNYMNYVFKDEEIVGRVNFKSQLVDLNEFMSSDESDESVIQEEDTTSLEVVEIPKNIDFVLAAQMDKILYDDMVMDDARGRIIIKDGIMDLDGFGFNILGGRIVMDGQYDSKDIENPNFDFVLDINQLSIPESFNTFNTVQTFAPVAKNMTGNYSTKFTISGDLGQDMMPLMNSISGSGLIKIAEAALKDSQVISSITSLTKLGNSDEVTIDDLDLSVSIKDGRLSVKPFDIKLGNYKTNISGSTGLEGDLDYVLDMDIPAGEIGGQVNSAIASLTGSTPKESDVIRLKIGLRGTYDKPRPTLLGSGSEGQVQEKVTEVATKEAKDLIANEVTDDPNAQKAIDSLAKIVDDPEAAKKMAEAAQKKIEDSIKAALEAKQKAIEDSIKKAAAEEAKKKLKNLFKKKGGN